MRHAHGFFADKGHGRALFFSGINHSESSLHTEIPKKFYLRKSDITAQIDNNGITIQTLRIMFLVLLEYKKPLEEVEKWMTDHVNFLEQYYARGKFIFSGRKNPRTGGIILVYNVSRDELDRILDEDPFNRNGIAEYSITEFIPTKYAGGFEKFVEGGGMPKA